MKVAQPAKVALFDLKLLNENEGLGTEAMQPWLVALLDALAIFFLKPLNQLVKRGTILSIRSLNR